MSSIDDTDRKSSGSLTKIVLIVTVILLIGVIAATFYQRESALDGATTENAAETAPFNPPVKRRTSGPTLPAAMAPALLQESFNLIDGKKRKLADYSGKILVVDIWATWCGPCRQEIPHLVEMAKEYKSKGVEVIGLTTEDPASDLQLVKDFSKEFNINYPIGWAHETIAEGLMNGRGGIPQTIIIGRDGKVRKHFVGFNPIISVPQMKQALDEAVAAG